MSVILFIALSLLIFHTTATGLFAIARPCILEMVPLTLQLLDSQTPMLCCQSGLNVIQIFNNQRQHGIMNHAVHIAIIKSHENARLLVSHGK